MVMLLRLVGVVAIGVENDNLIQERNMRVFVYVLTVEQVLIPSPL